MMIGCVGFGVAARGLQKRGVTVYAFCGFGMALFVLVQVLMLLRRILFDSPFMGCPDHLLGLLTELRGHVSVLLLHLRVRDGRQFVVTRLMRCDLRRTRASYALLFEVRLDLLTPWTGGVQVFPRVPDNLRLAAPAPFNFITPAVQAHR